MDPLSRILLCERPVPWIIRFMWTEQRGAAILSALITTRGSWLGILSFSGNDVVVAMITLPRGNDARVAFEEESGLRLQRK